MIVRPISQFVLVDLGVGSDEFAGLFGHADGDKLNSYPTIFALLVFKKGSVSDRKKGFWVPQKM